MREFIAVVICGLLLLVVAQMPNAGKGPRAASCVCKQD